MCTRRKPLVIGVSIALLGAVAVAAPLLFAPRGAHASSPTYDINTLAGKVASVNGTAGLQIRFSAFIQEQANPTDAASVLGADGTTVINPSGPTSVLAPDVTVNQDTAAAPQNETAIAVDPNNPNRLVGSANDYVTRTWSCTVSGKPCSALGDGYSGTYVSNDGGKTWCSVSSDPNHLGTLIPGVDHLAGGQYDAGGDPAVAFDSRGNVYYAGLGFNRTSAPNTVAVNQGTFDGSGNVTWSAPTFIDQTTSPTIFNDKEWIGADANATSPYRDRVYVTFTRFIFNPITGNYVQSPIMSAYSSDGGKTFSAPQIISGNVLYDQGSRPIVGPDGSVYVIFEGATRLATLDSTYIVKSTDGGATFGKPVQISTLNDISVLADARFRVNSFPAGAVAPNGTLYVAWSTQASDSTGGHSEAVYSVSSDGGATWTAPQAILPALDAQNRTPVGYDSSVSITPDVHRVDSLWPGVAVASSGQVYLSAYAADVVSPWQSCAKFDPKGSIHCLTPGPVVNNAKLDYVVTDLTPGVTKTMTTQSINTRYMFRGGFIGDYTDITAGSDGVVHALWTDTNNTQNVYWFYGTNFNGLPANQQDAVTASGNF
ncbi:MAG TPA: sialidase family protein [Ktedonobacterales bacterium]|nr:sialidase family protein [Ktedonobacterales bacterium]